MVDGGGAEQVRHLQHAAARHPLLSWRLFLNTATLTFDQSRYNSGYLAFTPVENEKVDHSPLQPTTAQQQALWDRYDANSYPFIDFGNKYDITEPLYDPQVLQGKTWAQIALCTTRRARSLRVPSEPQ
ncbi:MAG: hypothetical protein QOG05_1342, partial [Streptosporangiaceae bacterium]|nr:hypothetical protein [Streptosporangiaceae bacterium]